MLRRAPVAFSMDPEKDRSRTCNLAYELHLEGHVKGGGGGGQTDMFDMKQAFNDKRLWSKNGSVEETRLCTPLADSRKGEEKNSEQAGREARMQVA